MKCTFAFPALLVGFLTGLISAPATAQVPLLEVDYQNATIFHVLSDGRVLLPLGAAAGYVLTSDRNGYGTWQAVSGGGGLTMVSSNATLVGDGTGGNPLGVAAPLTLTGTGNGIVRGIHTNGNIGALGLTSAGIFGTHANSNHGILGHTDYGAYGRNANDNVGSLGGILYGASGEHAGGNFGRLGGSLFGASGRHVNGHYGRLGTSDTGAYGEHTNGNNGYLGSISYGAYGEHANGNNGRLGGSLYGVFGAYSNGIQGHLGSSSYGVYGRHINGHEGYLGSSDYGAYGEYTNGTFGFLGHEDYGVYGEHANGSYGHLGSPNAPVLGRSGGTYGTLGAGSGVSGYNNAGPWGYLGGSSIGALGVHLPGSNKGWLGHADYGVYGEGTPYAGYFEGDVHVTGTLSKGGGSFKIDHPFDPANQYLAHSFVESPDMMNVYNGNVVLNANGEAVVELPDYFEVLNRDFRYQLTAIGAPGPNLYIAEKISGNRFKIAGGQAGIEVSWQVTGIRQDRWAEEHRIVVEEDKPAEERGFYLHPRLYGQPEERSVVWGRDPEGMRAIQEMPAQIEAERRRIDEEHRQIEQERERMQAEREQRRPQPGS